MEPVLEFFYKAFEAVSRSDYAFEMDYVNHIEPIEKQTVDNFYLEYVWVVLNAGMKEQAARGIFDRFCDCHSIEFNPAPIPAQPEEPDVIPGTQKALLLESMGLFDPKKEA